MTDDTSCQTINTIVCQNCRGNNLNGHHWWQAINGDNSIILEYVCKDCDYRSYVYMEKGIVEYCRIVKNNPHALRPAFILDENSELNWPHFNNSSSTTNIDNVKSSQIGIDIQDG